VLVAVRLFCNAVFLGGILAGLAVFGYALTRSPAATTAAQLVLYYALPLIAAMGSAWALTRSAAFKINVALVLVSIGVAMLAGELLLARLPAVDVAADIAEAAGTELDSRTALQVALELTGRGEPAYPHLSASAARQFQLLVDGDRVIPLPGAVPEARTVFCNESGIWQTYRSDERGFRNEPGAWSAGTPDIALVGDSYTQGFCLPAEEGFAATLRETWPKTLNLGVTASGPLTELAILREYGVGLRPPIVVWFYYEGNDLPDLTQEVEDPILLRYLEPGFSQGLVARQERVGAELRARLETLVDGERTGADPDDPLRGIFAISEGGGTSVLRLGRLQNLLLGAQIPLPAKGSRLGIFPRIMEEAAATVRSWGGELYFVYLPAFTRYRTWVGEVGAERGEILEVIERLQIKLIDLDEIFSRQDDPRALWLHPAAHYTPAAYRLVGETVTARILQDGAGRE
jgi:hypothetical protein